MKAGLCSWCSDMGDQAAANYARNISTTIEDASYHTPLTPHEEGAFQAWVARNKVPFDPSPTSDYDMRGFYKGLVNGDPHAVTAINQNDGKLHFSDYWKTPYHNSFSAESKYATADAPRWNSKDQLVSKDGKVVVDERKTLRSVAASK